MQRHVRKVLYVAIQYNCHNGIGDRIALHDGADYRSFIEKQYTELVKAIILFCIVQVLNIFIDFVSLIKVAITGIIIFKTSFLLAWVPVLMFPIFFVVYTRFGNLLRANCR